MKKMFFSFALALAALRGFGQNLDSLAVVREVDSLIQVSRALTNKRDFAKALEVNSAVEKLALEKQGGESASYSSACFNHGRILYVKRDFSGAEKWYLESKAIREKVLGKEHPDYAWSLNNLAVLYRDVGNYEKAESLYIEAKVIREKVLGKEHPDYASSLNNLAVLYRDVGNYEKAEPLYIEAIAIREKTLGKKHPEYAGSLINLAVLYTNMVKYEKAEPLFVEAIAILEKALGKENPAYAKSLFGLANLYTVMSNYEKAERLYIEALAILEKVLGKEHPDYATCLNNMAGFYSAMNNYEKAEPLLVETVAILEKVLGKEHPNYAQGLSSLAGLYKNIGNYEKAEPLFIEALAAIEKVLGKEHPAYAKCLNNIAILYGSMGKYEKAESLYVEALAIQGKVLGKEHPDYATCLNDLASLYSNIGNYEKAEPLFVEALAIREKVLGKEHPHYTKSQHDLAKLYWTVKRLDIAQSLLSNALKSDESLLLKASRHLSERELTSYIREFADRGNQFFSFTQTKVGEYALCYNFSLFHKGFLLNAVSQVGKLALADSTTAEKYYLFKSYHRRLAAEYAAPLAERDSTKVADLEEKANNLEKDLTRAVAGFGEALRQVNWQEVQNSLKSNEVAIEFVHFKYSNPKPTDSILYVALLLRPDWPQPRMVGLFEQKTIQPLLNATNTSTAAAQLYAARGGDKKRGRTQKSEGIVVGIGETANLYQLIWQPLDSLLQGAKTIYFSPSGLLHRLNLSAIPVPGSNQTLADRYRLVQVGSTRQLVSGSGSGNKTRTAALFGGLKYDTQTTAATDTNATVTYDATSLRRSLGARGGEAWNYLSGTEKEIRTIVRTLEKSGYDFQSFTGFDGTEAAIKSLGTNKLSSPAVLHIATHGFFFPDPKDTVNRASLAVDREPVFKTSDNPLMRSGLILSGANHAWLGGKTPEGQEDGILTAYEISQMNLANTELVVLSACETGLGDVAGNEGVYGLQRAFKIAGAKYLIMSLWQVPDKQTSLLMTTFYKKWLEEKMEIPEAFRAAQKEMREQGFDPYQWAGFVLVE